MKLVIACLHTNQIICKCDFDCKSHTRCSCIKSMHSDWRIYQHRKSNHNCTAMPLSGGNIKKLVKYHMTNFDIKEMEFCFDSLNRNHVNELIYVPRGIRKLRINNAHGALNRWCYILPDTLRYLDVSDLNLSKIGLPQMPQKLKSLKCDNCLLNGMRPLPLKLKKLSCKNNGIGSLFLTPNMIHLDCTNAGISHLYHIPDTLKYLNCSYNKIDRLPELIFSNIETLICSNNNLKKLPKMPDTLKTLICYHNRKLHNIPPLPDGVQIFDMSNCMLNHVPNIPKKILLMYTSHDIVSIDEINLHSKLCNNIYGEIYKFSPYEKLLKLSDKKDDIEQLEDIIKQWYAVKIISDWFLECKYNPKYKYCKDRLQNEFDDLYDE